MADVRLTIAGRPYDVHCADGQEEQLVQLATLVDEKARGIQGGTEVRQLLFAALMLADEANERSEEHTSELQSLMRISYAVFCLKKHKKGSHTSVTKRIEFTNKT